MAIAAISTPVGNGGIAVIRISGTDAITIVNRLWQGKDLNTAKSHSAHLGTLADINGRAIDQAVATLFRGPKSYTGFDTVEISIHGSAYLQQIALQALVEAGATPAGPGEFTRQAFLNGRIDLAQAEGIADLMAASSRASAHVALTQLAGGFSKKLKQLRDRLLQLTSLLELELDFSEEDVEFANRSELSAGVREIRKEIEKLAASYKRGKVYKEGISVALAGVPNAGKSSLLNCLVEEDKAIVTNVAGTTRDVIEATAEINGILCRFYDTAGLRPTNDIVEEIGIEKARKRIEESAVVLWLLDPTQDMQPQIREMQNIVSQLDNKQIIKVYTKADMTFPAIDAKDTNIAISVKDNTGIDTLKTLISQQYETNESFPERANETLKNPHPQITGKLIETETLVTNLRHYSELMAALPYLERLEEGKDTLSADLMAEELRGVLRHIGAITGEITPPEILQNIFAHFCIGK